MNPVPFDLLEEQKENILPLKEGRSASALVNSFAQNPIQSRNRLDAEREELEDRLGQCDDLDDPIEPYLEYIKWTNDNYPQGSTSESCLIPLLERCTGRFRDDALYKDDPRFLKVWMQYIRFSESPKEIFVYLAKKEIGKHLATYYEEYAAFLESMERWNQASEVYQMGLSLEARPIERLKKKYHQFNERLNAVSPQLLNGGPSSPVLPVVRPPLATVSDASGETALSESMQAPIKSKIQIFADPSGESQINDVTQNPWGSIGTMASRRKENIMAATPWQGATLPQSEDHVHKVSRPAPVYRDNDGSQKKERIGVALQYLIDESGHETTFEEMLAKARGILDKQFPRSDAHQSLTPVETSKYPVSDHAFAFFNITDAPVARPPSPTMTAFTKAATEDVYDMFNQPLKPDTNVSSDDSSDEENDDNSDNSDDAAAEYSSDEEAAAPSGMGNLINETNDLSVNDIQTPSTTETIMMDQRGRHLPYMTPIIEANEHEQSLLMTNCSKRTINPADLATRNMFIGEIMNFLQQFGYNPFTDRSFGKYSTLRNALPFKTRKSTTEILSTALTMIEFPSSNQIFCFRKCIGEGGFGSVYLAESSLGQLKAIKVEKTTLPWEFYIMKKVEQRLHGTREFQSLIQAENYYAFADESYLVMNYMPQGTSLDMRNESNNLFEGNGLPEVCVMFFIVELLRTVESLHRNDIIHGDIKADNIMMRIDPGILTSKTYHRDGKNGWSNQGIVLIDFGRGIDLQLFEENCQFIANWKVDNEDCPEMRENKPWTFQADYWGIAGVVYILLFGQRISVRQETHAEGYCYYRPAMALKRYWQKELWTQLFDILLNPVLFCDKMNTQIPLTLSLAQCRTKFEDWLEINSESHGISLHKCLQDISQQLQSSRKYH